MIKLVKAGSAKTNNHRGKVTFKPSLPGMPSKYAVLVTVASALLASSGAHVIGYDLDAKNNLGAYIPSST